MLASVSLPLALSIAAFASAAEPPAAAPAVPAPPAIPARLDLATALRLLRERGLDLLAAEAAVAGAQGDLSSARAIANPALSLGYGRSFYYGRCADAAGNAVPCPSLPNPALSASVSDSGALADALSGKRGRRIDVARAALAAARQSRDDALRTLEAQLEQQYVSTVLGRAALGFAREVAEGSSRTLDLTRARLEAGAISEADVARVEVAKLEADQGVDAAAASLRQAKVALALLLGVRGPVPEFDVDPDGFESAAVPPGLASATRESLVERALRARPDVLAARSQLERAEAALALTRRQRFPDVTLSLSYAQEGTTPAAPTPPTWTFGLAFPLPVLYRQRGEIARAEADRSAQSLALARAQATAASEVEEAWAAFEGARAQAERMQGRLLERARTAADLVAIQYQKGAASLLDLLDARRTFIATRLEYYQDVEAYWTAVFRLEQAAGVKLR